jgi:hypothetical protein
MMDTGSGSGRHPADARDGPLADTANLTVANPDGRGRWPSPVVWADPPGERHLYELMALAVDADLALPVYAFVRTLRSEDPDPRVTWVLPQRYLM